MSVDETVVATTTSDQSLSADLVEDDQLQSDNESLNDFIAEVEPLEIDKIANSEPATQEFESVESPDLEFESAEFVSQELETIDSSVAEFGEDELENLEEAFSELEDSGVELENMIENANNSPTMGLTDFEDLKSTPIEKSPFLAVEVEKRPLSAHRVEVESPASQPETPPAENSPAPVPAPSSAPAPKNTDPSPAPTASPADSVKNTLSKLKSLPKKKRIKKNYKGKSRNTIALVIAISIALALGVCVGVLIYFIFFQE